MRFENHQKLVKAQALVRGFLAKKNYEQQKAALFQNEQHVIKLQNIARIALAKWETAERRNVYQSAVGAATKVDVLTIVIISRYKQLSGAIWSGKILEIPKIPLRILLRIHLGVHLRVRLGVHLRVRLRVRSRKLQTSLLKSKVFTA